MIEVESDERRSQSVSRYIGDCHGQRQGPILIVIGGLHANEPAGIDAALRVHNRIKHNHIRLTSGRFVSLRGNLRALSAEAPEPWLRDRYIDEDLNRSFLLDLDPRPVSNVEENERDELIEELVTIGADRVNPVYLLDLHTVSSDSPAFVALEDSLPARKFASGFYLPKILGMEEELSGLLIDYATNHLGFISCIIEAGRHEDSRSIDVHEAIVLLALRNLGMISDGTRTTGGDLPASVVKEASGGRGQQFYDVRERVPIRTDQFSMKADASAFMRVRSASTTVAVEGSEPVKASASGLLFLPNRQASPRIGDDAFFVIKRVGLLWLSISATVRKRELVHKLLPAVLPGVRRNKRDINSIIVAPEYAAFFRREILHLLGYRLVRWSHVPVMRWHRRPLSACRVFAKAVAGIVSFLFRGGEPVALPEERANDWVARRRLLDLKPPK